MDKERLTGMIPPVVAPFNERGDIVSQFCLSHGLASVPVARGTTILLLIPALSLLAGVVLFGEHLLLRQWLSCALVLAAAAVAVLARRRNPGWQPSSV